MDTILNVLGVIGAAIKEELSCESITSRLAIISGTSSCHMAVCYFQPHYNSQVIVSLQYTASVNCHDRSSSEGPY